MLDALRLGTHQLLSMRVPDHAAISTTVDLVRARVNTGAGNFANAVLRSVSERDLDEWIDEGRARRAGLADAVRRARLQPPGVGGRRAARGGRPATSCTTLLAADNENPRVTLVARPGPLHPRRAARGADALLAVRRGAGGRRPALGGGRGRGARRRPGRGLAAGRPGAGRRRRSRAATSSGWTCAPAPAARPGCWPRWPPSAAPRLVASERQPRPGRAGAPHAHADAGSGARRRSAWSPPTAPWRRTAPASSTGCSSTRPAPGWARCAAAPRRAGGASPTTCSRW